MLRFALALLALVLLLAACGGEGSAGSSPGETATLWVTRDRGAEVVAEGEVPAGVTALEALKRHTEVETRYGGRFVQAVNGIEGNLAEQRDWFYFVNGIEPDVGSAEVRLRPGDVVWWDFRSWRETMQQPVVVGAFPEPFLHGWAGKRRPASMEYPPALHAEAQALRGLLGGSAGEGEPNVFRLVVRRGADGAKLAAKRGGANDSPVTFTLSGSAKAVAAAARALARDPAVVRHRYDARFDESGRVVD